MSTKARREGEEGTNLSVLVELLSRDVVDGEDDLDVVLLGLLENGSSLLGSSLVVQGVSNLRVAKGKGREVSSKSSSALVSRRRL